MKNKIEMVIKKWSDITLREYERISELNMEELSESEKEIAMLALLCRVPEEQIWDMTVEEIKSLKGDISWMKSFDYPKKIQFKRIRIGDYTCTVDVNLQHMTIAQYVDFQSYFKDVNSHRAELLSVFFIPEGKKYNDGYEVADLIEAIRDNVDIVTFNSVCFFFLATYQNLTRHTLTSLAWTMRLKMLTSRGMQRKRLKEAIRGIKDVEESMVSLGFL